MSEGVPQMAALQLITIQEFYFEQTEPDDSLRHRPHKDIHPNNFTVLPNLLTLYLQNYLAWDLSFQHDNFLGKYNAQTRLLQFRWTQETLPYSKNIEINKVLSSGDPAAANCA